MFVQAEWTISSLSSLRYVVKSCGVTDVATKMKINIVDESCYSQTIGAQPLGQAGEDDPSAKAVSQYSQFKYTSFSMGTTQSTTQELACGITFCAVEDDDMYVLC